MSEALPTLLARWDFTVQSPGCVVVIPDGCRDLIRHAPAGGRPYWLVSELDDGARRVPVDAGDRFSGYRLRPATLIDTGRLLAELGDRAFEDDRVAERLAGCTRPDEAAAEALACLAAGLPIAAAARELGVTLRTLQRQVATATGRPPVFWRQLAQVRRAGRAVRTSAPLAETALAHGYADQAHMTRAFRRWLGASPGALVAGVPQAALLMDAGYD